MTSPISRAALAGFLAAGCVVAAEYSLASIDHVVLFMQENRAFDHYYGTMAGVRGFADPNVQVNPNGQNVFHQDVPASLSNATDELLPWYLNLVILPVQDPVVLSRTESRGIEENADTNHLVATKVESGQKRRSAWLLVTTDIAKSSLEGVANQGALNFGLNNQWPQNNTPWSWGHFKREDIPVQFGIADAYTVGDMYMESVIAATMPNRVVWASGNNHLNGDLFIDNMWSPGWLNTTLYYSSH